VALGLEPFAQRQGRLHAGLGFDPAAARGRLSGRYGAVTPGRDSSRVCIRRWPQHEFHGSAVAPVVNPPLPVRFVQNDRSGLEKSPCKPVVQEENREKGPRGSWAKN